MDEPEFSPAISSEEFQRLERQVRLLVRAILVLVMLIAIVPPVLSSLFRIRTLREHVLQEAAHTARLTTAYARKAQVDVRGLQAAVAEESDDEAIAWTRVVDLHGNVVAQYGTFGPTRLLKVVRMPVPHAAHPLHAVEIGPNEEPLYWDIARVFAIHISVGLVLGLVLWRFPIRALRDAIAELKSAHEQIVHQDRLATLGGMYAALTHEINNPLGVILARVRMLRSGASKWGFDAETTRDLETIERHGTRIAEIVRGLLTFARRTDFERRELDLRDVVDSVVGFVEKPFSKQQVAVVTELTPGLPKVLGSTPHLEQVLLNLVSNARDEMPSGGRIVIRTRAARRAVILEVEDSGPGFPHGVKDRMFEPFFTTKEVGKGTGLGLPVSYGIVRAHGGSLEAEDGPRGGALFRVTLPAIGAGQGTGRHGRRVAQA